MSRQSGFTLLGILSLAAAIPVSAAYLFEEVNGVVSMTAPHCTENRGGWKPVSGGGMQDPGSGGLYFKITFKKTGRYFVHMLGGVGSSGCGNDGANDCLLRFNGSPLGIDGYSGPLQPDGYRYSNSSCCNKACWEQGPKVGSHTPAELKTGVLYADVKSAGDHTFSIQHRSTGFIAYKVCMGTAMKAKPSGTGPAETLKGSATALLVTPPGSAVSSSGVSAVKVFSIHGRLLGAAVSGTSHRANGVTIRVPDRAMGAKIALVK